MPARPATTSSSTPGMATVRARAGGCTHPHDFFGVAGPCRPVSVCFPRARRGCAGASVPDARPLMIDTKQGVGVQGKKGGGTFGAPFSATIKSLPHTRRFFSLSLFSPRAPTAHPLPCSPRIHLQTDGPAGKTRRAAGPLGLTSALAALVTLAGPPCCQLGCPSHRTRAALLRPPPPRPPAPRRPTIPPRSCKNTHLACL